MLGPEEGLSVAVPTADELTPARLTETRSALAAFADSRVATVEAHPLSVNVDRSRGISLGAISPLAQQIGTLVLPASVA